MEFPSLIVQRKEARREWSSRHSVEKKERRLTHHVGLGCGCAYSKEKGRRGCVGKIFSLISLHSGLWGSKA